MLDAQQLYKIENRINEINKFLDDNRDYSKFDSLALFSERSELLFKRNKDNINIKLPRKEKYYYANQCHEFTEKVTKYGYNPRFKNYHFKVIKKRIRDNGISFNNYSINIGSNQFGDDLKRFSSKEEMLGFVIGYNVAYGG